MPTNVAHRPAARNILRVSAARMRVPLVVENTYKRKIVRIMQQVHEHCEKELGLRQDSAERSGRIMALNVRLQAAVKKPVERAFDDMQEGVRRATRFGLQAIDYRDTGLEQHVAAARERNVALVQGAVDDYTQQLRGILEENAGLTTEELADDLYERAGVSESRAELIARDQTLKLHAGINQLRQKNAGITQYTWSTSHDDRVRKGHADLDGHVFSWDDPPETNEDGDKNNPGEDFQCRCVAIPHFGDEEHGEDS